MRDYGGTFGEEFIEPKKEEVMADVDFNEFKDYKPEEVNDENEFKPIKGAYTCRIDRFERIKGTSKETLEPYDFYSLSLEIVEVMEGDKGVGRYLKRTYRSDNEGIKKLLNDMFTSGIELDKTSQQALDDSLASTKDKIVKVRTWVWTPDKDRFGNALAEEDRVSRQQVKIIKEFKLGKGGKDKSETPKDNEVPF